MLAFYAVVLAGIVIPITIFGPFLVFPVWGWFDPAMTQNPHFLHELGFIGVVLVGVLGLATQLYKPAKRVAGLQQALIVFAAFLVTMTGLTVAGDPNILGEASFFLIIFGPAVVAALLHPAGRGVLQTRTAGRFNPILAGLAVVAAIPLAAYVANQVGLHWSGDMHAVINHYAGMIVYSGVVVALALLASFKPTGWRIPLFSAAGLAVVLGVASVLYPNMASAVGMMWGAAAIVWAVLFVVVGMTSGRGKQSSRVVSEPEARVGGL